MKDLFDTRIIKFKNRLIHCQAQGVLKNDGIEFDTGYADMIFTFSSAMSLTNAKNVLALHQIWDVQSFKGDADYEVVN